MTTSFLLIFSTLGMPVASCKLLALTLRLLVLEMTTNDLRLLESVDGESSVRTLEQGYRGFSFAAGRLAKLGHLTSPQLLRCRAAISSLKTLIIQTPMKVERADAPPPRLELDDGGLSSKSGCDLFPFFDRFLRIESVDHLALPRRPILQQVPVDFLRIPEVVTTIEEALNALHHADRVCMLLLMQTPRKMQHAFICSLLENLFFSVLPVPKCKITRTSRNEKCLWASPVTYSFQLDVLVVLNRIFCHYISSLENYQRSEVRYSLRRLLTVYCMTAIADSMIRKRATDLPRYLRDVMFFKRPFFDISFVAKFPCFMVAIGHAELPLIVVLKHFLVQPKVKRWKTLNL
jgi:hypothetical protein